MLIAVGGRERTEDEFLDLLSCEGFDLEEVIVTTSPLRLLVAKVPVHLRTVHVERRGALETAKCAPTPTSQRIHKIRSLRDDVAARVASAPRDARLRFCRAPSAQVTRRSFNTADGARLYVGKGGSGQ
jgi:hypothetical protein